MHDTEGPDDMPAHVKAMLNGVSLHVPVIGGALALGTWQGLYVVEHRARPHGREVIFQFLGSRRLKETRTPAKLDISDRPGGILGGGPGRAALSPGWIALS